MTAETTTTERLSRFFKRGELVKICGLREPEHSAAAAVEGADLLGFIFAPARRQVTATKARTCVSAAREVAAGRTVLAVGVFVDASLPEIAAIVEAAELDVVQLHGAETPELIQSLPVPAIKVLRPRPELTSEQVISEINRYRSAATPPLAILVEGFSEHASGGAGVRADWEMVAEINAESPILLSGGLDPQNVRTAIHDVRPQGVDVSSGVEIDGVKDSALIAQFIRTAREAFLGAVGHVPAAPVPSPR